MRLQLYTGLDEVRFGMTRDQVRAILGPPHKISVDQEGDDSTEAWYYKDPELSAHFDSDCDWRLSTLDSSEASLELDGKRLIGKTEAELRTACNSISWQWNGDEFEPLHVDEWALNFWIEDGVLQSIQWWVPVDGNDRERWPE
ncbi:MAG: outer membrane protein assembly factor BamE [Planctomycetota bacterium]